MKHSRTSNNCFWTTQCSKNLRLPDQKNVRNYSKSANVLVTVFFIIISQVTLKLKRLVCSVKCSLKPETLTCYLSISKYCQLKFHQNVSSHHIQAFLGDQHFQHQSVFCGNFGIRKRAIGAASHSIMSSITAVLFVICYNVLHVSTLLFG